MKHPRNILAVVDPTAAKQPALAKAAELARRLDAALELFVCDFDSGLAGGLFDTERLQKSRDEFLKERRQRLEQLAEPLRRNGLTVTTDARWDNPLHEGLVRKIIAAHPDLVVKDTHYHSVVRRTLITNTDWHLIRDCPAPLLLAKATAWSPALRAVAAVDPGHLGDKPASLDHLILDWGETLAKTFGGELHVLHMHFPATLVAATAGIAGVPMAAAGGTAEKLIEDERRQRMDQLTELAAAHGLSPDRIHLKLGTAADLLPEEADRLRADVIVMGAVSRSRLERIFIGSTAERVLDRLPCDVLVVKPLDFAPELPF